MATTSVELLSSPKYSNPYPSNARCYWKLQAAPNHVILLDFMDIHLQDSTNCEKDGITIYNGGGLSAPLLGVICGVNTDNVKPSMVSTSNQMFIAFKSDDTEPTYNGFSAYYVARKVEYCDNVTTIISEDTVLSTPGYPDGYSGKSNCYNQWLVQAPKIDDTIKISMADIVLPPNIPCVNCYMRIFDGPDSNSKILATICSATLADEYTSSTNELYIEFYTAFPWTGNSGIAANISIIEIPEVQHPNGNHSNHHPDDHIPNGSGYNPAGAIAVFVSIVLMTVIVYVTNKYKIRCSRNRRRRGSDHFALVNEMDT
ncbi:uncharacterized protein TRIADDRAFT_53888 [Trichoplax adhaerens]|uniref:CUB domain-containing protein n=2 Tax=Trichoplax adhaerens TaxID=10228 RepID=B3RMB5_TRIAD|nr:hypothetical protein TRIADDRAFT_53888 [Trichoplax adhaerens]EDV27821.1 hypothetical protein TRIADDRAFT_53888 [Trichoplax adhaerens]|eukprot:XP_002109655.1 hypothetical protein TRIADDRAFT_53888 [Trichoplax adhaerens]